MKSFYTGVLFIFLSAVCFGVMPIFALYAYKGGVGVMALLFLRFLMTALFFFGYVLFKKERISGILSRLAPLFILGGVLYTVQSTFYFSALLFSERLTWPQLAGAAAVLLGALFVITAKREKPAVENVKAA